MIWLIAALALLAGAYVFLIAPGRMPRGAATALFKAHFAHRGLHTRDLSVPENSPAAFGAAVSAGYGIELDVGLTADGQAVVFHDDDLGRVCGVDRALAECTWAELQGYRLHGTDQRIPLLSEVLALVGGRVPLLIEIKSSKHNRELCECVAALLDGYEGPYCIESFHPGIVRWFYKNRPRVVRGQLAAGAANYRELPRYQALLLSGLLLNAAGRPQFIAYRHQDAGRSLPLRIAKRMGAGLVGWTVRDDDDIGACLRFFDAIIFEYFCL